MSCCLSVDQPSTNFPITSRMIQIPLPLRRIQYALQEFTQTFKLDRLEDPTIDAQRDQVVALAFKERSGYNENGDAAIEAL